MSLIDATTPPGADNMTPDEKRRFEMLQAHRALGLLIQRIPLDMPMTDLRITSRGVEAMYNVHPQKLSDSQARLSMRALVGRLGEGFEYTERPHGGAEDMNKVSVIGSIAGVRVEVWVLLAPCQCICHAGDGAPC